MTTFAKLVKQILESSNGAFITVTFTKKDGSERTINGRTGVTKGLAGGKRTSNPDEYFLIYENNNGYRNIKIENVTEIRMNGRIFSISENI